MEKALCIRGEGRIAIVAYPPNGSESLEMAEMRVAFKFFLAQSTKILVRSN